MQGIWTEVFFKISFFFVYHDFLLDISVLKHFGVRFIAITNF